MNIFILEDNKDRISFFRKRFAELKPDAILTIVDNVADARKDLKKEDKWDLILLDHDLDDRVYVDSNEPNTGYQVAKFIKENDIKYAQLITHTHNPAGAKNIVALLGCMHIPFANLRSMFK